MRIGVNGSGGLPSKPDAELADALDALSRPPAPVRMPPVPLRLRVRTSPALRAVIPARLALARAERHARAAWEREDGEREDVIAAMEIAIGASARAHELEPLARARLIEVHIERALFWRPWPTMKIDAESAARVRSAFAAQRGLIASACHLGAYHRTTSAFAAMGYVPYAVSGAWFFERPSADYWGRRLARWRRGIKSRPVLATKSYPVLRALLERGELVYNMFDVRGSQETRFLGRRAMLAGGTARLAVETGALVLPVRAYRRGPHVWLEAGTALDPREYPGRAQLHDALAAVHERLILADPAALEDPRTLGWVDEPPAERPAPPAELPGAS